MMFPHCFMQCSARVLWTYSAIFLDEHDIGNLRKIRRCWMSSNAESHSQVTEVVGKSHYSAIPRLLLAQPAMLRKQFKHFYLAQIALWDGGKN